MKSEEEHGPVFAQDSSLGCVHLLLAIIGLDFDTFFI